LIVVSRGLKIRQDDWARWTAFPIRYGNADQLSADVSARFASQTHAEYIPQCESRPSVDRNTKQKRFSARRIDGTHSASQKHTRHSLLSGIPLPLSPFTNQKLHLGHPSTSLIARNICPNFAFEADAGNSYGK